MTLTVLNDIHLATARVAGTTPQSAQAMRAWQYEALQELLPDNDLMILGDLFDSANVPLADLQTTYKLLHGWLARGHKLFNVRGNHDMSKSSGVMSSFDFLCALLSSQHPNHVTVSSPMMTDYGYIIPHLANQDLFDVALAAVPDCANLYIHANIMNGFAAQSDQSLNVSIEQIGACKAHRIICAHEHAQRDVGKVTITGNQIPTSVADWLSGKDKFYMHDGNLMPCYKLADYFTTVDWNSLEVPDRKFIRVIGTATQEEASQVLLKVAAMRAKSSAFVMTNAVEILTDGGISESFESALNEAKAFDVKKVLYELLTKDEIKILESLL